MPDPPEDTQYGVSIPNHTNRPNHPIRSFPKHDEALGSKSVQEAEPIKLLPGVSDEADHVLDSSPDTVTRIERVVRLSEGFESAYGMELLASVHWVATRENTKAAADPEIAAELVGAWNARKHRMMGPDHVAKAWSHLRNERWLASSARAGAR